MATQKPISTISYNTEPFLKEKLETWYNAHIIQAYMYIVHKGEDGDKDHIHLRIEPNKRIDAMDLQEELKEYLIGEEKPRGCRPFRPSKEEDWFLYAVHEPDYLKLKYSGGEKGEKLPYSWQDIVAPEGYDVEIAFIRARQSIKHSTANIAKAITEGENPIDMVMSGENPYMVNAIMRTIGDSQYRTLLKQYRSLEKQWSDLMEALYDAGIDVEIDGQKGLKIVISEELKEQAAKDRKAERQAHVSDFLELPEGTPDPFGLD